MKKKSHSFYFIKKKKITKALPSKLQTPDTSLILSNPMMSYFKLSVFPVLLINRIFNIQNLKKKIH